MVPHRCPLTCPCETPVSQQQSLAFRIFRRLALSVQSRFAGFDPGMGRRPPDGVALTVDHHSPPVLIVGAPRSGTTMLYQLLLSCADLAYISNLLAAFPALMPRLCRAWPRLAGPYSPQVREAEQGFIPGLLSPSEAGKIMDAWFGSADATRNAAQIRATVAAISEARCAPLLVKSLTIGQHLDRLRATFPKARLIHIRRDSVYVAQSILLSRQRLAIKPGEWWSVRAPGDPPRPLQSDEEAAAWQAVSVDRFLAAKLASDGTVVRVDYEGLCDRPEVEMARLVDGLGLAPRPAPALFDEAMPSRNRRVVAQPSWDRLCQAVGAFTSAPIDIEVCAGPPGSG